MSRKVHFSNSDSWGWAESLPFPQAVEVGDQVFVSGQQTLNAEGEVIDKGDIAAQTRNVFENMKRSLALAGLELSDLVRLNTYYVFDGDDDNATTFWEDMTRVRLEYFPDPGPAATAVRIQGMPYDGQLIQIEGIAVKGESRRDRQRIMPDGSWDWSIAVPLSQGWRVGERIFVGGQISADKQGKPVATNDIAAQTRNIYGFIRQVVEDAGGRTEDIVHVKICAKHRNSADAQAYLRDIFDISAETFPDPGPVFTAFGVDLLYPGLVLEIDAMAIIDAGRRRLSAEALGGRYQPGFCSDGWSAAGEIHVGGQVALAADGRVLAPGDVEEQAAIVFDRMRQVLAKDGAGLEDLAKLNLFIVGPPGAPDVADSFHKVARVWHETAPEAYPAMTPVRVFGLPGDGLLVQADGIALK